MQREIKFRAWDIPDEISFPDGCMSYFGINNFLKGDYDVLMQYTGLKDKNGKEIYEGDIVKFEKRWDNKELSDVVTMERFPRYWLKNETFGYEGEELDDPQECEVIGNIYQGPELINTK